MDSKTSAVILPETKLEMLKEAKGGTWYDDWKPYCGTCDTMGRMVQHDFGFQCQNCCNMIGWDCIRLSDSPLNNEGHVVYSNRFVSRSAFGQYIKQATVVHELEHKDRMPALEQAAKYLELDHIYFGVTIWHSLEMTRKELKEQVDEKPWLLLAGEMLPLSYVNGLK